MQGRAVSRLGTKNRCVHISSEMVWCRYWGSRCPPGSAMTYGRTLQLKPKFEEKFESSLSYVRFIR